MQKRILAFLLLCLVAAPAAAIEINGQLKHADLENLSSDPSSPAEGRIYINTTSHKAKYRANSAWLTVVDTTHALLSVMTATGDIIYSADNSGTPARLQIGGGATVLHGGTVPVYGQVINADVAVGANVARSKLAVGTASHVLINDGSGVMSSEATLAVSRGGTALASGTSGGILGFTGSTTLTSSGALAANGVVLGGGAGSTPSATTAGSADQVLRVPGAGGAPAFGAVDLTKTAAVTGALPVGNGGTGIASGTSGGVPYFSGSSTVASSAALASNGVVYGGGAGSAPATATAGTADQVLVTPHAGGAPVMGQVDVSKSAAVTGALGPANGGTGVANNAASTLAISGNFATTLTVSGITGVTLPTSGTLLANSRTINTTAPITGGGDLSADRTIAIPAADGTHNGYLTSTDWTSFNSVTSGSVPSSRTISTTAPLTGGGDLSANRTIAIPVATNSANGYLSSGDWVTFNQLNSGSVYGRAIVPTSMIRADTGNGHGSTNSRVRRFTNHVDSGTDITFADSSTAGSTFTVNSAGIYSISYSDVRSGGQTIFGISLNSAQLTTNVLSITTANRLILTETSGAGVYSNCSVTVILSAGDVIRAHDDNNADGTTADTQFVITQVEKQ